MNAGVGIGLFICLVIIVIAGVALKINTDNEIEDIKIDINTWVLTLKSHICSQNTKLDNMCDIIKKQQEEIKILKGMIEPEENKCCCGNCRFYHELNNQDSVCLNVDVNNCHKTETTLYADNRSLLSWRTIKGVKPNECCKLYRPKEASNE